MFATRETSKKVSKDSSSYFEGHCKCFYMDLEAQFEVPTLETIGWCLQNYMQKALHGDKNILI